MRRRRYFVVALYVYVRNVPTMQSTKHPVYRIEAAGETAQPFPTLAAAIAMSPRDAEAYVATSVDGVHLADALQDGAYLRWALTLPGQDVIDAQGWQVAS